MKLNLPFILLFSLCLISCGNREDEIIDVVNKWNELHNTHNVIEFKEIYASNVLFYGRQTSMETCYAKKKALLTPAFRQEIISAITISYYSSGIIKCDFTKRTRYRKEKVREYYCYLLLNKQGSKYLITGESDLLSDQRRNTQLDLGNKLAGPSDRTGIYVTLIIILIASAIVYWLRKKRNNEAKDWEVFKAQYKAPEIPEKRNTALLPINMPYDEYLADKIKAAAKEENKNHFTKDSPQEKGFLFEKYVVEKFDRTIFQLFEWRSDKFHEGIYAISNSLPDLEYNFKTSRHNFRLGIECKWRSKFANKKIEIASERNLKNYWQYSKDRAIPVFIILGVGGKPEAPEELFIIPLDEIQGPVLYRNQLNKYKRKYIENGFFYDGDSNTLS